MSELQAKHLKDYQSPAFTISELDMLVDLYPSETRVIARSQVIRCRENEALLLDGEGLELKSVKVNNDAHPYQIVAGQLRLEGLPATFELEIETQLDPVGNTSLEGLYMSDGAYCTQCEAEGFRRVTYFLDRPDVLAKYRVRIEAPRKGFPYLLSNGNKVEAGELDGDRHYVVWEDPFPKPSYLFALVAGDFDLLQDSFVTQSGRDVALEVFVDKGNLHKAHHAMESLKKSMAWDESRFGLEYDLDIYMIVAVDFFNMGAMENKGLNIFNTKYVLADTESATDDDFHGIESVVGHEYFHNWTGNRVTCRDWFQLSLKEGLTVFRDQEFSSDVGSRAVNRIQAIKVIKNQQFAEDSGPMAHPIRPKSVIEMNNFYTVTVYNKGAEVIRMMHTLLGEAGFQAGMKLYFQRHDGQAVTCDDFVAAMEDASGVDLSQFRLWYNQAGTPTLKVSDSFDVNSGEYRLVVLQQLPPQAGDDAKPMHIPFDLELIGEDGKSLVNKVLDVKEAHNEFVFEGLSARPVPSLLQNFSAPVKLEYDFTTAQLISLMRHASSEVARWEASVSLISRAIWGNVNTLIAGGDMALDTRVADAFRAVLLDEELDTQLAAEILNLPSINALIEQVDSVNFDALVSARAFVLEELSANLEDELLVRYRELYNVDTAPARALKNACLAMLARGGLCPEELVEKQFNESSNMTDSLAALGAAMAGEHDCLDTLLERFEQRWVDTPLVMDKWFMLQASRQDDAVLGRIDALVSHKAFSLNNPNRVRSLIGCFAANNPVQFHREDGEGYRLLTRYLKQLNGVNPQVAARIITPLIQFGKFDEVRKQNMKACLEQLIALPELSRDLYEKVSRALSQ
ncbi:aminopeptidase N [Shewanella zhangzhouensis]|uniref:aminopeptidase N n=1 Tax=Shewanella zhangzhouensis TaxID=2864213 RepID=UPI001C6621D9|nr:aminopeptidase N [Shewanella zhangzhouensis]QYK06826.1 aminopeptidase N [Shewanella zhangzhouensis]